MDDFNEGVSHFFFFRNQCKAHLTMSAMSCGHGFAASKLTLKCEIRIYTAVWQVVRGRAG